MADTPLDPEAGPAHAGRQSRWASDGFGAVEYWG